MFNFKSNSWLDRFESQNSATVQAQAGLEIEVVDFSPGGFVMGHISEVAPGRFMLVVYKPEEDGAKPSNQELQNLQQNLQTSGIPFQGCSPGAGWAGSQTG
ncbi:unnamed protein product [Cladocopium goreaui]|uniref:Uncharacterized protein n=1 Tax=Cladocopium goreaui TaxID=2562237 RepID=A0A9P1FYP3_9DINO|nr:unnamed protein product [Cladocopium goreaui]